MDVAEALVGFGAGVIVGYLVRRPDGAQVIIQLPEGAEFSLDFLKQAFLEALKEFYVTEIFELVLEIDKKTTTSSDYETVVEYEVESNKKLKLMGVSVCPDSNGIDYGTYEIMVGSVLKETALLTTFSLSSGIELKTKDKVRIRHKSDGTNLIASNGVIWGLLTEGD